MVQFFFLFINKVLLITHVQSKNNFGTEPKTIFVY